MPPRTYKKKKRFVKKRNYKKRARVQRVARPLRPAIYKFKRSVQQIVPLNQNNGIWVNNDTGGIANTFTFKLSDLNEVTDFTNLFKYYKISAVRAQMYFSNSVTDLGLASRFANNQLLIWTDINSNGTVAAADTNVAYLNSQTAKKRICLTTDRKPIDLYMPVKLSNSVYESAISSDYTLMRPKWISCVEDDTPHYGANMSISRVSEQTLTSDSTGPSYMKIIFTYYIQCKKVE